MNFLKGIASLLFPQARCLACDEPRDVAPGSVLCGKCEASLASRLIPDASCPQCRSPKKSAAPCFYCLEGGMLGIEKAYAPYMYKDAARMLVIRLKFGPVEAAAEPLAKAMAREVSGQPFDALVPVPLSKGHLRERGLNQSRLLCERLESALRLPVLDALVKVRETKKQSGLPAKHRRKNVQGAFEAIGDVRGKRILLVDDVRTTGSTARECARILREAGAASVSLVTAAVAPHHGRMEDTP